MDYRDLSQFGNQIELETTADAETLVAWANGLNGKNTLHVKMLIVGD